MGSIVGHRIDYDGVGVPRPAAHTQQNLTQVPPPPGGEEPFGKGPNGRLVQVQTDWGRKSIYKCQMLQFRREAMEFDFT